ncbi:MAG: hypothetical protein ACWA5P_00290 [bacterium]
MVSKIASYILFANKFIGLEHHKGGISGVEVKKSGEEIKVNRQFKATSIEELLPVLGKASAVFLVLSHENVITKEINKIGAFEQQVLVKQAFPNMRLNDFYWEVVEGNNKFWVSICRKKHVEDIINKYQDHDVNVVNFQLGEGILSKTQALFNTNPVVTSSKEIHFENQLIDIITDIELSSNRLYTVDNETISNNEVLSLSTVLNSVKAFYPTNGNATERLNELRNAYKHKRLFKLGITAVVAILFTSLLINTFYFNHYYDKVQSLEAKVASNSSTKSKIVKLDEEITKKQKLVDELLSSKQSKSTYYIDEIINTLPKSILLSELTYQPILGRIKENEAINFKTNLLKVKGVSAIKEGFDTWIQQLTLKNWISSIEVIDYKDKQGNSFFELEVLLND